MIDGLRLPHPGAGRRATTGSTPRDYRGTLAISVLGCCVGWAAFLGAIGAVITIIPVFLAGPNDVHTSLTVAGIAAVVGVVFGLAVGSSSASRWRRWSRLGHRRLGPRAVAALIPVTALFVTLALTVAVFGRVGPLAVAAVSVLDTILTLLGGTYVAGRYRLLAGVSSRVH